jgi:hypothetical protein
LRIAVVLGLVALVAGFAPLVGLRGTARAEAAPVTVKGTVSGDHAWNPTTNKPYPQAPTVSIDQVTNLTDQVVHVSWKHFTPSNNPAGPFFNEGNTNYAVTVLECRGTSPAAPKTWRWPDFGPDCYNYTPDNDSASAGVGNEVYTLTGANGEGEAYFHVETRVENSFLKCSENTPCSIVVVPNWGGVQPAGSAPGSKSVHCDNHKDDTSFIFGHYALDSNIGGACSWSDRVVVPLHFAPTPQNCPARDYAFVAQGAPMIARTMQQWQAGWCSGSNGLSFDFDSGTNEYLARQSFFSGSGALTSATDVAVVNQPADATTAEQRKFTYAPITNTAITVAYHIDDEQTGKLVTDLTLDARLVAKLLTQSYALDFGCRLGGNTTKQGASCDPAVKGNPVDIFDDPEFQRLNPEYTRADFPSTNLLNRGQFLPLVVSGDSDMVHELTRWLMSDKAARSFIAGKADQWGMHVNTYYKKEPLPASQFQVLDPGYTARETNGVPGQSTMQVTWNPLSGLSNVATSLVIDRPSAINPTLPACGTAGIPCVYQRFGSQPPGNRALFAVVGLNDAAADRFPVAKLVNAAGKAVAPTTSSLHTALAAMRTDGNGITKTPDFSAKAATQYPLTTVEYALVPSCGLAPKTAAAVSDFLTRVTKSQRTGLLPGQLAPGNLRLTGAQLRQTRTAAGEVSSASCTNKQPHPTHSPTDTHAPPGGGNPGGGDGGLTNPGGNGPVGAADASSKTASAKPSKSAPVTVPASSSAAPSTSATTSLAAFGVKHADSAGPDGVALPAILALIAALAVGGPGTLLLLRTPFGTTVVRRARSAYQGLHR